MTAWTAIEEVSVALDFGTDGRVPVGTLAQVAGGATFFEYAAAFAGTGLDPAPLLWPTTPDLVEVGGSGRQALTGMFRDVLPDGWAKRLLFARLRDGGYAPEDIGALDLLALVGPNHVGALDFAPTRALPQSVTPLTIDDLAATIVGTHGAGDAGVAIAQTLAGSLGGARPKASIWFDGDRPAALPRDGGHPWIVKFPNPVTDLPDAGGVEFAYSLMAAAAGIEMPPTRLLESGTGPGYFAVSRFDRLGGRRFHFQSLSGLVDRDPIDGGTYEELLLDHMALTSADQPSEQLIRRMVFNVVASVRDDHVRNHGFLMNSHGAWVASPAYDVTFDDLKRHELGVGSNASDPGREHLREVVAAAGGDPAIADRLTSEIVDVVAEWPAFARRAGLANATIERISATLAPLRGGRRILQKPSGALTRQAATASPAATVRSKGPEADPESALRPPPSRDR